MLPLSKKDELVARRREVLATLQPHFMCDYDETQAIGRRYRRQDELGTPLCVTFDFDSLDDHAVTVRDRDSMDQDRVPIDRARRPPAATASASDTCSARRVRSAEATTCGLSARRTVATRDSGMLKISSSTPASTNGRRSSATDILRLADREAGRRLRAGGVGEDHLRVSAVCSSDSVSMHAVDIHVTAMSSAGSRPTVGAVAVQHLDLVADGVEVAGDVAGVGVLGDELERALLAAAADHDRDAVIVDGRGRLRASRMR